MVQRTQMHKHSALVRQYDVLCKQTLARGIYLAWIVKTCVREFEKIDVKEIAEKYIIGTPGILSGLSTFEAWYLLWEQNDFVTEGYRFYRITL